ncbi:MAG TPA: hypothetical protein VLU54_11350 [Casimicrobiaceae bacterium]|nr:hypothetical protein [Casimicrobiaceae bacterium]
MTKSRLATASAVLVAMLAAGCATQPPAPGADAALAVPVASTSMAQAVADPFASMPPADVQERLLALDPDHIDDRDVREVLARGPAPRIILVHGGIYPVYLLMKSFGLFLAGMGYPESRIRDPRTGDWSYSPYEDSADIAGMIAWQYEHDGMRPMLIGHSLGAMQVVRILHQMAGDYATSLRVFDPLTGSLEARTSIVDPYTGRGRPVVGVSVAYASAVGTAFLKAREWSIIDQLLTIPDNTEEFTGFTLELDPARWTFTASAAELGRNGRPRVRNVMLPSNYSHVFVPAAAPLAEDPAVRDWINAYVPNAPHDVSSLPEYAQDHVLWAADVWYSIKRHWCLEAQRLVRAYRERTAAPGKPRAMTSTQGG